MAEGTGLEPAYPCGRRFSRPLHYHYATPPRFTSAETISYDSSSAQPASAAGVLMQVRPQASVLLVCLSITPMRIDDEQLSQGAELRAFIHFVRSFTRGRNRARFSSGCVWE